MVIQHRRIRVRADAAALDLDAAEPDIFITLLGRESRREHHRVGVEHIVEKTGSTLAHSLLLHYLCIEPEVELGGIRQLVGYVVLEIEHILLEVVVEYIVGRSLGYTCVMVEVQGHIISSLVTSSLDIDIGPLIEVEVTEKKLFPVYIRIYIRIQSAPCILYILLRIDRSLAPPGHIRLIVKFHPGRSVHEVHHIHRLGKHCLHSRVDLGTHILRTVLGGYDHDTVRTADTIDSSRRSILEHCETLDGLRRNTVQVIGGDLHIIKKDKRSGYTAEGVDTSYVEFGGGTRITGICNRDHSGQLTRNVGSKV